MGLGARGEAGAAALAGVGRAWSQVKGTISSLTSDSVDRGAIWTQKPCLTGASVSLTMWLMQVLHTRCFCVLWMFGSVILCA